MTNAKIGYVVLDVEAESSRIALESLQAIEGRRQEPQGQELVPVAAPPCQPPFSGSAGATVTRRSAPSPTLKVRRPGSSDTARCTIRLS